ncbi:peptidase YpeB-like protein [Actinomadura hallensis]|uniref:Peptidase YpeB-like protein n=1 Tax=Actinomadura hallensis TaxID=337895 RepID=A0A543IGY2_9ACTN|nr:PepSY domain-containing protein [Actinomadura hallensis]TQM69838.1 peptidase YpeB-like protein [Actinomadura hallensis]
MSKDVRRMFTGRRLLVALVAAGVVAGGGATAFAAANADGRDGGRDGGQVAPAGAGPAVAESPSATPSGEPSGGPVTVLDAAAAALKAAPGKIDEIELDDGVWEVEILADNGRWRDLKVDAGSGKVLSDRADDDDDDDDAAALRKAKLTASDAAEAALKAAPGTVTAVEFDEDDGRLVWEVEVKGEDGNERELEVNASSGKVAFDDDDDDGDDDRDDD